MLKTLKVYYQYAAYVLVAIIVTYAIAQPLLDEIFPELKEHVLSNYFLIVLLITLVTSFLFLLEDRLEGIEKLSTTIVNLDLDAAIMFAAEKLNNNISEAKIFAFTTAVIHPIVRSGKFAIGDCKLMLHQIDPVNSSMSNAAYLSEHNEQIVKNWEELRTEKKIGNLKVSKYAHVPTDYFIVFDDKILIQGMYFYKDDSPYGNEYEQPIVVTSDSIEAHKYIVKASRRFDNMWNYWREISGEVKL